MSQTSIFSPAEISFILDGIDLFDEDDDDYVSEDGKYKLTNKQIENLKIKLKEKLG